MPNWKKLLTSGSDASLNSLHVDDSINASSLTGSLSFDNLTGVPTLISSSDQVTLSSTNGFSSFSSSLDSRIDTEKSRVDAILLSADADKDSFAEIVSLINSVDTTNDNAFASFYTASTGRLSSLESYTSSLQSTSLVSGSSQIDITNTVGFSTFSSSIDSSIDNRVLTSTFNTYSGSSAGALRTEYQAGDSALSASAHTQREALKYTDSKVKSKLNAEGVISGSSQITITESQISDLTHYTNSDVLSYINSLQVVSGSVSTYGDSNVLSYINGIGVISGSSQITLASATGNLTAARISDFDTEVSNNTSVAANTAKTGYTDALVKSKLNTEAVLSGSITSANITDVDAFSQSGTYASLRAQGTTKADVGLGNVTNESKATMFTNAALTGNPTAPTQTGTDDSTKIATTAFVQGRIDAIIGTAGSTLDTLGELSASLASDQSALSSLTTTVGTKLAKASNLSDLTNAATARTNLGLGTAATTDSTAYATAAQGTKADTAHGWGNHASAGYLTSQTSHADVVVDGDFTSNGLMKRTAAGTYGIVTDNSSNWNTAYGWGNHAAAGYITSADGGNAQTLDSIDSTGFIRDLGDVTITDFDSLADGFIGSNETTATNQPVANHNITFTLSNDASSERKAQVFFGDTQGSMYWRAKQGSTTGWHPWEKIWTNQNDGAGSGLDADLLDGNHASAFALSSHNHDSNYVNVTGDSMSGLLTIARSGDHQLQLTGTDTWAGIGFADSNASSQEYLWYHGANKTFALGGGGSNVSGKKLHIDGGVTIGSNLDSTAMPTNGLMVEGAVVLRGQANDYDGNDRSSYWSYDDKVALALEPAADDGAVAIFFKSIGNSPSDFAYIAFDEDYGEAGVTAGENCALILGCENDGGGSSDHVRVKGRLVVEADMSSSDPTMAFQVKSSNTTSDLFNVARAGGGYLAGTFNVTGDVVAYYSSDERLKDNLKPIDNATEKVKKLTGYEFDWNDKQDVYEGHDIGVVAQEVEEVLPEIVTTRDNGYKAVKYEKLTALLIEAVKDQQKQIEKLTQEINDLRRS